MNANSIYSDINVGAVAETALKAHNASIAESSKTDVKPNRPPGSKAIRDEVELAGGGSITDRATRDKPIVINGFGVGLRFSFDKETNTQMIEVVDLRAVK